jgi:caa(3)-type oxidase subunit IV
MDDINLESLKTKKKKVGVIVFTVLTILTVIEFAIALLDTSLTFLLVLIALAKASLIIVYFMHIGRVFSGIFEQRGLVCQSSD